MASSLVDTFRLSRDSSEQDVARLVLLGIPAKNALNRLLESEDTGMKSLVTYVAYESGLNARDAGKRAERTGAASGAPSSIRLIARATARTSPWRTRSASTSLSGPSL